MLTNVGQGKTDQSLGRDLADKDHPDDHEHFADLAQFGAATLRLR
jgi:hypothetical protein